MSGISCIIDIFDPTWSLYRYHHLLLSRDGPKVCSGRSMQISPEWTTTLYFADWRCDFTDFPEDLKESQEFLGDLLFSWKILVLCRQHDLLIDLEIDGSLSTIIVALESSLIMLHAALRLYNYFSTDMQLYADSQWYVLSNQAISMAGNPLKTIFKSTTPMESDTVELMANSTNGNDEVHV